MQLSLQTPSGRFSTAMYSQIMDGRVLSSTLPCLGDKCYFRINIFRVAVKSPAVTESRVDSVDNV